VLVLEIGLVLRLLQHGDCDGLGLGLGLVLGLRNLGRVKARFTAGEGAHHDGTEGELHDEGHGREAGSPADSSVHCGHHGAEDEVQRPCHGLHSNANQAPRCAERAKRCADYAAAP